MLSWKLSDNFTIENFLSNFRVTATQRRRPFPDEIQKNSTTWSFQ